MRKNFLDVETSLALIKQDITYIKHNVRDIRGKLENEYITKESFDPVKRIVYGLVTLILIAVVMAILALIIQK